MEYITKGITRWLIKNGAINDIDKELYEYALYSMLITISPLLVVIIIGIGMGTLLEGVLLIIPFMCIRKFSGGYHAKNVGICFVSSCGILIVCMYLAANLPYAWWITVVTLLSVLSLCINSPIDSENRRLDDIEKRRCKKITIGLSSVYGIVHIIFVCTELEKIATCIAVGICLTASLQLPCVLQFHNKHENGAV